MRCRCGAHLGPSVTKKIHWGRKWLAPHQRPLGRRQEREGQVPFPLPVAPQADLPNMAPRCASRRHRGQDLLEVQLEVEEWGVAVSFAVAASVALALLL